MGATGTSQMYVMCNLFLFGATDTLDSTHQVWKQMPFSFYFATMASYVFHE